MVVYEKMLKARTQQLTSLDQKRLCLSSLVFPVCTKRTHMNAHMIFAETQIKTEIVLQWLL